MFLNFERKEERVYKALHLGDTLNLSSTIGLAFTEANKLYISSIKTSEVEDYANLLKFTESWSWNFDKDINKTALIDAGIGDDHSTIGLFRG